MSSECRSGEGYVGAEALLPFGELLQDIRGTDKALHVGWYAPEKRGGYRDHRWIAHAPEYGDGPHEFLFVRIATGIGGVQHYQFETAVEALRPRAVVFDYELVSKRVVPVERTPIPYKREDSLTVECPECERFGVTHPWKLDDYLPEVCECGYRGEFDVE